VRYCSINIDLASLKSSSPPNPLYFALVSSSLRPYETITCPRPMQNLSVEENDSNEGLPPQLRAACLPAHPRQKGFQRRGRRENRGKALRNQESLSSATCHLFPLSIFRESGKETLRASARFRGTSPAWRW